MPRDHRTRRPMPHPLARPSSTPLTRPPVLRVVPGDLVPSRTVDTAPVRRRHWYVRPPLPHRGPDWGRVAAWTFGLLAGAAAIAGLVWLLVLAVAELVAILTALVALVVAWVQANWVWLVLGAIAVLVLLVRLGGSSSCAGLHCGGCRGGRHR